MSTRQRLDEALVARGLYPSRSRAARRGAARHGEGRRRPGREAVADGGRQQCAHHQRRGAALRLARRAEAEARAGAFGISARHRNCLDIGASTGGFTQVLLEEGAAQVTAIDVGHGQMKLADPRVTLIEGLNARDLAAAHLDMADSAHRLRRELHLAEAGPAAGAGSWRRRARLLVALIKPQFEAGREAVGKGGIVSDPAEHERVCAESRLPARGRLAGAGVTASPVEGGDGNREFLVGAGKGLRSSLSDPENIPYIYSDTMLITRARACC